MVHGGLRYLLAGQIKLAKNSLKERERLLREAPGLVESMGFLLSHYRGRKPAVCSFNMLLRIYDLLAGRWTHKYYPAREYALLAPHIRLNGLKGGTSYADAVTDDARLVLRVLREAQWDGAFALNYVSAEQLLTQRKKVAGVAVRDALTGASAELLAANVINATGTWCDGLRRQVGGRRHVRPLQGSHLVFPYWRLPVAQAITLKHPVDGRPVFALPWEGVTIVGNTDLDLDQDPAAEISITPQEIDYLLEFIRWQFPSLDITERDLVSTYAGVRPVLNTGAADPAREKRDHLIWVERGLISVSGGKLTTFRLIAADVLERVCGLPSGPQVERQGEPFFRKPPVLAGGLRNLDSWLPKRLLGRYGPEAEDVFESADKSELERIPGTDTVWAELRWALRREAVVHLDDLLLRRTRIGLLLPLGGAAYFDRIHRICQQELGWNEAHWNREAAAYRTLWRSYYSLPNRTAKQKSSRSDHY
jgi:glycerol-3-phosphate dehydrogenase